MHMYQFLCIIRKDKPGCEEEESMPPTDTFPSTAQRETGPRGGQSEHVEDKGREHRHRIKKRRCLGSRGSAPRKGPVRARAIAPVRRSRGRGWGQWRRQRTGARPRGSGGARAHPQGRGKSTVKKRGRGPHLDLVPPCALESSRRW
jgi:hypothetical protein